MLIVHWHDLGRYLGVYGHADVHSPRLDALAAEGILFTRAHATAPLCSPSRGSLFTGRYPQSNGLVGLAHHGWEYRSGVRTLPALLTEAGWHTALFGMQHETSVPSRLGFDEFDVSNSYCEYVVERATAWLRDPPDRKFLLTAGFFETHRPYPHDRYEPADAGRVTCPTTCPTPRTCGQTSPTSTARSPSPTPPWGNCSTCSTRRVWPTNTWVVFMTDHGPGASPREVHALRRGHRYRVDRPAAARPRRPGAAVYDDLFSGVDLLPTLLELLGVQVPADVDGLSHAANLLQYSGEVRSEVYTTKTYHDSFDPIEQSEPRNTATSRITRSDRCSTCPGTSRRAHPGRRWRRMSTRRVPSVNSTT